MHQPIIPYWKSFVKRTVDIAGALLGVVVSLPVVLLAAIAIKLDSPGPVFYRQIRSGRYGWPFHIIKLRTMVWDADMQTDVQIKAFVTEGTDLVYKMPDDPRVTHVGRVLRRVSLDEAPQFFNVLRGDMSLVGPRPEDERIVRLYPHEHRQRLAVKPGITGPMQVNGRGDLSAEERLELELDYIENYSLLRDLKILLQTIPAIVNGEGAY